jgi:hypothetical protein
MARKAFVVTDAMRGRVRSLAGVGVRQEDIATIIGCDPKTLRKHFRDELDRGIAEANAEIAGCLFDAAKKGNVAAQIFWLKTRGHWQENRAPEHPIPGTDAEAKPATVVILPDNGRDPKLLITTPAVNSAKPASIISSVTSIPSVSFELVVAFAMRGVSTSSRPAVAVCFSAVEG